MLDWFWPEWHQDRSGVARRVEIPDAGGWMYQFRGGDAAYNHVFVPNMDVWTKAIAAALDQNLVVSVALDLAHVTKTKQPIPNERELTMANFQLMNDDVCRIPIMGMDGLGDLVALPPGRTPTLSNSDPASLNAIIDGNDLVINALVDTATDIVVEVDDGTLKPFMFHIDIVEDVEPTSVALNLAAVTHTSQPRPVTAVPTPTPEPPTPTPEPPTPTPEPPTPAPDQNP